MRKYAMIILAGLSLAACKKKEGEAVAPINPGQGKDARITLNITSAANIGTYASSKGEDAGTENERKITTIDVFLYNDDGGLSPAGYKRFSGAEATLGTKTIETKTGRKRIYVGINLPQSLADLLKNNFTAMESPYAVNMAQLADPNNGVMMFNQSVASLDIKEGNDAANKISIPVTRLLAKAGVMQHENLSLATQGGTLSDLKYTVAQRNKQIFVGQLYDFKDPNWNFIDPAAADYANAFTGVLNTEYQTVNEKNTATAALNTMYIPENTSKGSEPTQLTYIQVRTKFTPTEVKGGALPADGTFFVMFGQIGSNPYIHQLYFATEAAANAEAAKDIYKNGNVQQTAVLKYDKGLCYYRLYLNEDQAAAANKGGITRNTFFKAQISKFKGLGTPSEGQIPGTPGTPGNPGGGVTPTDPTDPTKPITPGNVDANIEATISIVPWLLITSEHEI